MKVVPSVVGGHVGGPVQDEHHQLLLALHHKFKFNLAGLGVVVGGVVIDIAVGAVVVVDGSGSVVCGGVNDVAVVVYVSVVVAVVVCGCA